MRPNVELGKKIAITTNQYNLIVDYRIMDHESDSTVVPELKERLGKKYSIQCWRFDKGFWSKENKRLLSEATKTHVLLKKGKCNKKEAEEEHQDIFKKLRNKHSTVESNINELKHHGLDRYPDKGYHNFKRYIGLAVYAYNLKKISVEIIAAIQKEKQYKNEGTKLAA